MLEVGDHSKESCQFGMNLSIPLEQAINGLVCTLEPGEQSRGYCLENGQLVNPGHTKYEQASEDLSVNVLDDEAGIAGMDASLD